MPYIWNSPDTANPQVLLNLSIPILSSEASDSLTRPFSIVAILEGLQFIPLDKSPGPYGFHAKFFNQFLDLVKLQVLMAFRQFQTTSSLPSFWSSTYLCLILKVANPTRVYDFSPISLCNLISRLLSKCLARRMMGFLPILIGA